MNHLPTDKTDDTARGPVDDIVPARGLGLHPIVGLGGSAGAIPALKNFFQTMPADSGLVFAVILHLAPKQESALAELLQRSTPMPVRQVSETVRAEPNTVYVIPPGKALASVDGYLRLADVEREKGRHVAVDIFFRTLADSCGSQATAIVLSGADGDGASGIKRIKERGGLTIAQDPALTYAFSIGSDRGRRTDDSVARFIASRATRHACQTV